MDKDELLERYEALGEDDDFLAAKPLFEAEIQRQEENAAGLHGPDAALLRQYGYLLTCHGRITIRRAIEQYQRSIDLGPSDDKVQYMWIGAKGSLGEAEDAITRYREQVAASPRDVRGLRFLAYAYLAAKDFEAASGVIEAGLALAPDDVALLDNRGEVKAHEGDPDGALADWRRAHELDPREFQPGLCQRLPAGTGGTARGGRRGVAPHPGLRHRARLGTDGRLAQAGDSALARAARKAGGSRRVTASGRILVPEPPCALSSPKTLPWSGRAWWRSWPTAATRWRSWWR